MKNKKIIQQLELEMSKAKGVNVLADIKQAYYNDPGILKVKGDEKMKRQRSETAGNGSRRKFFTFASVIAAGLAVIITAAVILPGILKNGNDSEAQAAYNSALSKMVQENYLNIETNNNNSQSAYVFEKGNMVSVYSDDEAEVQWLNENGSILMDKEEELYYKNTDADISELSQNINSVLFGSDDISFSFGESNAINVKSQGVDYTVELENGMIKTVTPKNNPNHKKNLDYGKKGGYYAPVGIVSVFVYNFNDTYLTQVRNELIKVGLGVDSMFDAKRSTERQINQIEQAIEKGTDLLIVNVVDANDYAAQQTISNMAENAGIPIIYFKRFISDEVLNNYVQSCFIGVHPVEAGISQGQMIADYLLRAENINEDGTSKFAGSDGAIKYTLLQGEILHPESQWRSLYSVRTAQAMLDKAGKDWKLVNAGAGKSGSGWGWTNADLFLDLDILRDAEGNLLSDSDKDIMNTFIYGEWQKYLAYANFQAAYPDSDIVNPDNSINKDNLGIIIANNDAMAMGVLQYLQEQNINTGDLEKTVPIFSIDADNEAINAMQQGYIVGTISQSPVDLAETIFAVATNLLNGNDFLVNTNYTFTEGVNKLYVPYIIVMI